MRRSMRTSSGQRSRRLARYRGDSGSTFQSSAASAIGTTPPTMKSARHPYAGATRLAIELARNPPSGMQTMVSVTANGRCRRGTYSDASVAALGMAPPRPIPAMNRSTPSAQSELTNAIAIVRTANAITLPSSAVRRP